MMVEVMKRACQSYIKYMRDCVCLRDSRVQHQKVRCNPQGRALFENKSVVNVWPNSKIYTLKT